MNLKVKLIRTCGACPEQYDGYIDGEKVAYLRLRHGYFQVEYKGKVVYSSSPNGDGIFTFEERDNELTNACKAIIAAHSTGEEGDYYTIEDEVINDAQET